ncbi:hypothetical protein [Wolbachia endosymbiont of Pentidionis agamae]|uniref:hypothetical protein n=1 Tax=Wolbachia endosymbiont of Pentidionis agamae TaxID=3110435 RepID=UPI002FD23983
MRRVEEFLKFLESEKLKDILYSKFWWNENEHYPKDKEELRWLIRKFGEHKIAWCSSNVSHYAKLDDKTLSKKQILFISACVGVMFLLLGIYFVPGFVAASIYLKLWQEFIRTYFEKKL